MSRIRRAMSAEVQWLSLRVRMALTGRVQRIHYAESPYLTGDAIAEAVVACAEALARQGTAAATVAIPVRLADGSASRVDLLIGPSSQIVVEPVDDAGDELVDADAVARIRVVTDRARLAQVATSVTTEHQDGTSVPGMEDLEA